MVPSTEPGLPQPDVSGSEFEVGAPTSEEDVERKKSRTKRAQKSPLMAVLESWLLSVLYCRFFGRISGSFSVHFAGDAKAIPGVS